jgi:hypothetical protein
MVEAAQATPFADTVVSFAGGTGFGVIDQSGGVHTGASGAGTFDPLAVTALDGAALGLGGASGTPGTIVMSFSTGSVTDGTGADVRFYDSFGVAEGFILDISANGINFFNVGIFPGNFSQSCSPGSPCITDVDISPSGLTTAAFFKLTANQASSVGNFPEAYDLDAIEALNFAPAEAPILEPDYFLSYQIKHKLKLYLADQFGEGFFTIKKPVALLNPVDKEGEGISDSATYLISHKVKGPGFEELKNVLVENQFGELFVDVTTPDRLLVPASKSLIGPVFAPDNSTHNVDNFLCYRIEVNEGTAPYEPILGVRLADQVEEKLVYIRKPTRLCIPVDMNGEGIKNPDNHLMCYSVRRAKGEPEHEPIDGIFVNEQFGPGQVDIETEERELCVPSTKPLL